VLPVHPAADLFPMLGRDELLELGEDIKKNGLRCPIVIWSRDKYGTEYLLDGRNRLEAMELAGLLCLSNGTLALNRGDVIWPLEREYLRWDTHAPDGVLDHEHPSHLVASLNIHRARLKPCAAPCCATRKVRRRVRSARRSTTSPPMTGLRHERPHHSIPRARRCRGLHLRGEGRRRPARDCRLAWLVVRFA
jgi:hypothetical protein